MEKPSSAAITVVRGLGPLASISIVVGSLIATGVFLKTPVILCHVGTPGMVLAVWVAAGVLSLGGALAYAELASMLPRSGGEYVFLREAYGAPLAFLYGWTRFFIANAGGQAALVLAFSMFLNALTGGVLDRNFFAVEVLGYEIRFGLLQAVALATIAVITLINCARVSVNGKIAAALTGLKVTLVFGICAAAFLSPQGSWEHFASAPVTGGCEGMGETGLAGGFGAGMLAALWAYNGWYSLTLVGGEVRDPQRNIPLGLIGGTSAVVVLYALLNVAYFYALSPAEMLSLPGSSGVATEVVQRLLGPIGAGLVTAALLASAFGALHTGILTNARVPYAMARDRLFLESHTKLSPNTRVPIKSLVMQAQWTSVLALAGSLDTLTDSVMFATWIFYSLVVASVFVLRRKMPGLERPFRTPGYPVVPALFLLATAWLLVDTIISEPRRSLLGLGMILLGLPVYWYFSRRGRVSYRDDGGEA